MKSAFELVRGPSRWIAATGVALIASIALSQRAPDAREPSEPVELTVYAAVSARDALQAIAAAHAKEHPGVAIVFNFGSSGDLARQIVAANEADVFLSADEKEMDRVAAADLVATSTRRDLLSNQLVVVEPLDPDRPERTLFAQPFAPKQLAHAAIERLSLANVETVPAGRYAKQWLEKHELWDAVASRVVPAVDVRAALAAVESGAAQAGIVYRTDVARSRKARVVHAVPLDEGPRIVYPIAALKDRPRLERAKALVDYFGGAKAKALFEQHGFIVLARKVEAK